MQNGVESVKIANGIYWVGVNQDNPYMRCNPYLLIDDDEAVLFDPGSVLDFEGVYENIKGLIPLEKIKYVVLHHQDPDLVSAVPLFEQKGCKFTVVTHWRTQTIIKYYGIKSDYYLVDEHDYRLKLASGREIIFVPTPYLHFAGAIASYDTKSKVLFSSDLFGALGNNKELYADEGYMERMKTFHEHYMPANSILRSVMEMLLLMDINIIAPQHGSIINKQIKTHIKALRDLECGFFIEPVRKELKKAGGYVFVCNIINKRYAAVYSEKELQEALSGLELVMEGSQIQDYNYSGPELWQKLFENIYLKKGIKWLLVIEPFMEKLCKEYDLPIPRIFNSKLKTSKQKILLLKEEVRELKSINESLNSNVNETKGKIIICPVTNLYNENFFREYLKTDLAQPDLPENKINKCLMILSIDNMSEISLLFGDKEADNTLKTVAYILKDIKEENHLLFRLQGPKIACFMANVTKEQAILTAEKCRNEIKSSKKFIDNITVSIGITSLDEFSKGDYNSKSLPEAMYAVTMMRLRLAKTKGGNIVCSDSFLNDYDRKRGKILVVDDDAVNRDVLKNFLENAQYSVITANDGEAALALAETETPDLILSETMLPKIDGFLLCEKLFSHSATKNIPFMLVSYLKNEDFIKRSLSLGIEHYFKKPYMMSELLGIIELKLRGDKFDEA